MIQKQERKKEAHRNFHAEELVHKNLFGTNSTVITDLYVLQNSNTISCRWTCNTDMTKLNYLNSKDLFCGHRSTHMMSILSPILWIICGWCHISDHRPVTGTDTSSFEQIPIQGKQAKNAIQIYDIEYYRQNSSIFLKQETKMLIQMSVLFHGMKHTSRITRFDPSTNGMPNIALTPIIPKS